MRTVLQAAGHVTSGSTGKALYDALQKIGVDSEFFYPAKEQGEYNHGFLMNFRRDEAAAACMRGLKDFVKRHL